jgi:hypothetical protein
MMRIIKPAHRSAKGMMAVKRTVRQKTQIALRNAKASLAIEGLFLTPQEDQLLSLRSERKLKESEFLARALELAQNA